MFEPGKHSKFLPHGSGMQLIDAVVTYDEKKIICKTKSHLALQNPLYVNGKLPVTAYVEYAAQAAGLHLALSQQHGVAPAKGYIGTLKDIQFCFFDVVTDELCITAEVLVREQKTAIYHVIIAIDSSIIMDGRISLSQA